MQIYCVKLFHSPLGKSGARNKWRLYCKRWAPTLANLVPSILAPSQRERRQEQRERLMDARPAVSLGWGMWESRKAHTEGGERASVWRHHGASNQTQKIHLLRDKLTNSQRARCRKHFDFQVSALGLINSARRWMDGINKTWSAGEIQFHPATLRNQKQ